MPDGVEGSIDGRVQMRRLADVPDGRLVVGRWRRGGRVAGGNVQLGGDQMELQQFEFVAAPDGADAQAAGQAVGDGRSALVVVQADLVQQIVDALLAGGKGGVGVLGWREGWIEC